MHQARILKDNLSPWSPHIVDVYKIHLACHKISKVKKKKNNYILTWHQHVKVNYVACQDYITFLFINDACCKWEIEHGLCACTER